MEPIQVMPICMEHSGMVEKISNVEKITQANALEIVSIKRWLIATLTSGLLTLAGVVITLVIK